MLARMLLDGSQLVSSINLGTMPTPSAGTYWNSIAAGNGVFVAIIGPHGGASGTTPTVSECAVSRDGISWSAYALPRSQVYNGVFFLNAKFYLIASSGTSLESADGQTWTDSTAPASYTAGAYGNGIYLLTKTNNTSPYGAYYAKSSDGVTWTTGTASLSTSSAFGQQCVFANGLFFSTTVGGTLSNQFSGYSSDGQNWTAITFYCYSNSNYVGILATNGKEAAIYYAHRQTFTNTDGTTVHSNDDYNPTYPIYPTVGLLAGGSGYFVKFGAVSVRFSQDGLSWSYLPLPATFAGQACAFNPANRTYCAVGATQSVALTL